MKNRIRVLLFFFLPLIIRAQTYHFASYGVKDGLAQSNVSGIVQDTSGFYWIATAGGVSRFDGKHFVNFTTENGLADNNVSAIYLDREQQLWLGHENGSLTRYDGEKFVEIRSNVLPRDKKIYGFFEDAEGIMWISTEASGAIRITDTARKVSKGRHIRAFSGRDGLSQYVLSATEDKSGNMWFLTDIGIKTLEKGKRSFEFFRPPGMPPGQVSTVSRTHDFNLIMGTLNGSIYEYNVAAKTFEMLLDPATLMRTIKATGPLYVYTLTEDRSGNIWASILNFGVVRIERKSKKITWFHSANGLAVNKIRSIFEDREGNIMLGTSGEGVQVYSGEKFVSFTKTNGLTDNQVCAISQDRSGALWFGTNEGITVYDPAAGEDRIYRHITTRDGLTANNIRAIVRDKEGNLWIAIWGGRVVKFDARQNRIVQVPALNDIVNTLAGSLMLDSKNQLWIGSNEGIVRYDLTSSGIKTFRTIDGLIDNDVTCLFEDSKGNVWIGTQKKGVSMYNGKGFAKFTRENGLVYGNVSAIAEDQKGRIWIGTEGGGAFVYDGRTFKNFKARDGLTSDFITLIARDASGSMWLGTNKGLNKYDTQQNTFRTFDEGDGFTGLETKPRAVFTDQAGDMWFGTVNGAFRYSPKRSSVPAAPPVLKMLQFKVNLRESPVEKNIELSYKENNLMFDYIGISLRNPKGVHYKVKLEGFDENERIVKSTSEVFSNLQPNRYTFSVTACNESGQCSQPVVLKIRITPPYWKTWWFYLIIFSAFATVLFVYIKIREKKLQTEKRILEEKVNERTAEVVEKNKELDEINKDITASIRYAKRIQDAILPPDDFVRSNLPETFILFRPKDIVSGDFYWMERRNDIVMFAAVDCTGHGVPGAFMSIVGHNLLDRVVGEQHVTQPSRILDELNKGISETLRQTTHEDNTVRDGMDIALCAYHRNTNRLEFAGAYNPMWLIRNGELREIKADKFPIGNTGAGEDKRFTNHEIDLMKGDTIYIFSDGYSDQFGGPNGKKFKASSLKQLLLSSQHLSMSEQRDLLLRNIEQWRGSLEQVDDILVIGTRFT